MGRRDGVRREGGNERVSQLVSEGVSERARGGRQGPPREPSSRQRRWQRPATAPATPPPPDGGIAGPLSNRLKRDSNCLTRDSFPSLLGPASVHGPRRGELEIRNSRSYRNACGSAFRLCCIDLGPRRPTGASPPRLGPRTLAPIRPPKRPRSAPGAPPSVMKDTEPSPRTAPKAPPPAGP